MGQRDVHLVHPIGLVDLGSPGRRVDDIPDPPFQMNERAFTWIGPRPSAGLTLVPLCPGDLPTDRFGLGLSGFGPVRGVLPLLAVLGVLGDPEMILVSAEGELGLRGLAEGPLSASSSSDEKSLFS